MSTAEPDLPVNQTIRAGTSVLAVAAAVALLYFGRVFFITLAIAIIIAFLLDPVVTMFVRFRLPRPVASFVVCSSALVLLYLLGLGLYTEFASFVEDLPAYSQRINDLVDSVATQVDQVEKRTIETIVPKRFQDQQPSTAQAAAKVKGRKNAPAQQTAPPPIPEVRIHTDPKPLLAYLYGYLRSFYDVLLMASFVPFLVYFMLSWRDHMRRRFLYLFSATDRYIAGKSWERMAEMQRGYVIGNFILGCMLAVLTCCFFFAIKLPYWPLIGVLSGFLSLVPYVGLLLAIAPALVAALPAFSQPGVYILIAAVIAVLHLVALNLLYPKLVGSRVHLNPLVVTVALMLWGTLWGGIGLLLAIPITAGIKAVFDNVARLQGYGKLLGD
ncbi:MAG TPA: AI-2E family transporter [Bryobacteraceae bacterium]|nr:AI-2E family transporter [Bryobacteraceae bacterium]